MDVRALLFTDVVDSTLLVERLGDAQAARLWAEHDRRARALIERHGGREIDRTDGFFLVFDEPAQAAALALDYHRAIADLALRARVGLHVGAVTLRQNDPRDIARGAKPIEVEGLAKPFAARIMALAGPGQTLLSGAAWAALQGALPAESEFESHGRYRLKGVDDPVEVFELGQRGSAPFAPPADAEKAYRVIRRGDLWHPLRDVPNNLVPERDPFVGRAGELLALGRKLDAGARLLTVVGPGGTGKTRLVRRYARVWLGDWPGGVWFCDLSEARGVDGIHFAVATALGVPLGKGDADVQLGHAIEGRGRCLIVLDNFEQIVTHAAATLQPWLDRARQAAFIVTSRERLHLPGETLFPVEPLALADEALELFETRARAQRPDFALVPGNRAAVAEVVRLLDGLPLAIELAAARSRVLAPAQLVERLRDRFAILAGAGGPGARQATLRAAIDWSWELLAPWEQSALAQCSVFDGGFTLEAAEALLDLSAWREAPPALDAVQSLVDKSLLRSWTRAEGSRLDLDEPYFGMYLSIHEYAAARLEAGGTGALRAACARHGRYFAGFGTDAGLEALSGHGGWRLRRTLAFEIDNLVVACRRAVQASDGATAIHTYSAAWEILEMQGPYALGVELGRPVAALDGVAPALRAAAVATLATALRHCGRLDEAEAAFERAGELGRAAGDRMREALTSSSIGLIRYDQGRFEQAEEMLTQALAAMRALGHRRGEATVLANLGNLFLDQGRADEARLKYEAAIALARADGNLRVEALVLGNLASLHNEQGRVDEARPVFESALALHRTMGSRRSEGIVLGNLGLLHYNRNEYDTAQRLIDAALAIHREVGNRRGEGAILGHLGVRHHNRGEFDAARVHYEMALAVHREVGNRADAAAILGAMANIHRDQGRWDEARAGYDEALALIRQVGGRRVEGWMLGDFGELLVKQGRLDEAREWLVVGQALLVDVGDPIALAKLLCARVSTELAAGDRVAARTALGALEEAAAMIDPSPSPELERDIDAFQAALK